MKEHWSHLFRLRMAIVLLSFPISSLAQVPFWMPLRGPDGGGVLVLLKDPTGMLFAGTEKGIFRSINDGLTWTLTGPNVAHIKALVTDSSGAILAGGQGMWRSTDGGSSWHPFGLTAELVRDLVVTRDGTIFAAVGGIPGTKRVLRSTDGGSEWVTTSSSDLDVWHFLSSPRYGLLATGGWSSVYRWAGIDSNWLEIFPSLGRVESLAEDSSGYLYAGRELAGVSRSTNGGLSWDETGLGSPYTVATLASVETGQLFAGVRPLDESIDAGAYCSADRGQTWRSLGLKDWPVYSILPRDSSNILLASARGIFKSTNGGTDWEAYCQGITACDVNALLCLDSTTLFAGTGSGLFRSVDNGETWSDWGLIARTGISSLVLDHTKNLFAATRVSPAGGGIFKSTDEGKTWKNTTQGYLYDAYTYVSAFDVTRQNTLIAWVNKVPYPEFYRSTDRGETWMEVASHAVTSQLKQFAMDSSGAIYGATWGAGVVRSTDDGLTWTQTNQGLDILNIYGIAARHPGEVFAGGIGGASRSTDGGDSWSLITGRLGNVIVTALGIDPGGDILLAIEGGNVYRSSDSGETWNTETINGPVATVMNFVEKGGPMFATDSLGAVYCLKKPLDEATASSLFSPKMELSTGSFPWSSITVDIDGDGKVDLCSPIYDLNSVGLFRNTGSPGDLSAGFFAPLVTFPTGNGPTGIASGDFDLDGKMDLAIANAVSGSLSIFRNVSVRGTLQLANKMDIPVGKAPKGLAVGDLDGDGKADIAIPDEGDSSISILRNVSANGSVSFSTLAPIRVGLGPLKAVIADLDRDGLPDIAVVNNLSNSVSLLRNVSAAGSISFAPPIHFPTGSGPGRMAITDIDGDNVPDLVVDNINDGTLSVHRNMSISGSFSFSQPVVIPSGNKPWSVGTGDFDGDGKPDVAVTSYSDSSVTIFINKSSPGAITQNSLRNVGTLKTGLNPLNVEVGDLDGDGNPDLIVACRASNTLSLFRNRLNASPVPAAVTLLVPADNSSVNKDSVQFLWSPGSPAVQRYRCVLASDSLFMNPVTDALVTDVSMVVRGLPGGQVYWWKVAAENATGWGPFSVTRRFTTLLTGVGDIQEVPREFSLSQNYPNPFNPRTVVRSQTPEVSYVRIVIYDVLGREVAVLVNERRAAGRYQDTFDASMLSSGIYICRMTAGAFVQSTKMLLIK